MSSKLKLISLILAVVLPLGCTTTTNAPQSGANYPLTVFDGDQGVWVPAGNSGSGLPSADSLAYTANGPFPVAMSDVVSVADSPEAKVPMDLPEKGRIKSPISDAEADVLREAAKSLPPSALLQSELSLPSPQNLTALGGFAGPDANDCCGGGLNVPPDPELAVGPDHVIAVVNVAFAIYDKSGNLLSGPTTFDSFFDPLCAGTFDPNALYDEENDRFILGIDGGGTDYCVAATTGSDPTGTWYRYNFATDVGGNFFDYPHAGVGLNAIYMGANMFAGGFAEGRVWAMDKTAMYAGAPMNVVTRSTGSQGTPQPMNLHGFLQGTWPGGGPHYVLTDGPFNGSNFNVWSWDDPFGANTFTNTGSVDLNAFTGEVAAFPIDAPQGGSIQLLEANDWRVQDAEYRNGSIFMSHTMACNPGGGTVNCLRWAEIDPTGPTVIDAGVFGTPGVHRTFADVAANDCGDLAVGYTHTTSGTFPSVYVNGREAGDPAGTLQTEVLAKAGERSYDSFQRPGPHRWGDYSGMTIDPDGQTFWYLGEYSKDITNFNLTTWATWISSFKFDNCGTPPPLPGQATNPSPTDSATGVNVDADLAWTAGADAATHDIYFGTASPPPFVTNQAATTYDPGTLTANTTYYWQIDEKNVAGTTEGMVWSFTTGIASPLPATDPNPADGAIDVDTEADLSWTAGAGADSHDVYFGTFSPPAFAGNQAGTSFDPGSLSESTVYYWRIDEKNAGGTTTGTEWSFTTVDPPATEIHLDAISGFSTPGARNRWTATVEVTVTDDVGAPVGGVLMDGVWSNGANGGASCTTNASGQCSVSKGNLKSNVSSVVFTVNSLSGTNLVYNPALDTADNPITVFKDGPPANEPPTANPDTFNTAKNTGFSGNVLDNDDKGTPEATVTGNDPTTTPGGVTVTVSANGSFSYTPPVDFVGADTFSYTIANSEGSSSALVTINVSDDPGGALTLTATERRTRGEWYVDLVWENGSGTGTVDITRNGGTIASDTANDGAYTDNLGKKPSGTFTYQVCEDDTGDCASDSVSF